MVVGIPRETYPGEGRVAVTPEVAATLLDKGVSGIVVEEGAGEAAGFPDDEYVARGAEIASRTEVFSRASVILQVIVFRTTGRRVFLMSPLHHHFELAGWGERRTVIVFTALQLAGALTAFAWLRLGLSWGLSGLTLVLATVAVLLLKYNRRARE